MRKGHPGRIAQGAGLGALMALALCTCSSQGRLPAIEVEGDGASEVRFTEWRDVQVHGQVVRYEARLTRLSQAPIGTITYRLYDANNEELAKADAYYRREIEPGQYAQATFPAYKGEIVGNRVAKLIINVKAERRKQTTVLPEIRFPQ